MAHTTKTMRLMDDVLSVATVYGSDLLTDI